MKYDVVVVGGGIVGAATAWRLLEARPGSAVLLVDKEPSFAKHQTGHNSGVVHSGIYYAPGSLKAELCRRGAEEIKLFAQEHGVPLLELGKLIVATTRAEVGRMDALFERAHANGVEVERITGAELREWEPAVIGSAALSVPSTAVTDYVAVTNTLVRLVSSLGGAARSGVEVTGVHETSLGVTLLTTAGEITSERVVFCAGLQSDRMAQLAGLGGDVRIVPFRGEYYDVAPGRTDLVRRLIYPVPDPDLPFLGVHLTPTVTSGLTLGPNAVLGLAREGYRKGSLDWRDVRDIAAFPGTWQVARTHARTGLRELRDSWWRRGYLRACRRYCPSLTLDDMRPREAGIRAQAVRRDGTFVHDFLLRRTGRTLHVLNAPSPAATSALPIARRLAGAVLDAD